MLQPTPTDGDSSWFVRDRFGLFIHWGLYALAARHEWMQSNEKVPADVYQARYFKRFDPDLYDPELWAKAAGDAGMKYFVVTTKHHEGFCLWDSQLTDYKAPNSPAGRDLLRPMVDAFRARNMRVGFYHSLIDWHHPNYVIDNRNHPRRAELAADPSINQGRDQKKYIDYLHGQVRELLTQFGPIDVLWFDFSFVDKEHRDDLSRGKGREAWGSEQLLKLIRQLQPKILLTDRLDLDRPLSGGDFKTPEQAQPRGWVMVDGKPVVWEACQTFSGSWGYYRDEHSWRSTKQLLTTLIDCVSKGGNLLLNVGPTGRGEFDERALDRLAGIGDWMRRHARSIYDCTQAPDEFPCPRDCRLTWNPQKKRMYVHLLAWPYKHVFLDGAFAERVEYAQLLHDASEVKLGMDNWHAQQLGSTGPSLVLNLPQTEPNVTIPVVELFLKG
jgi:alpha-L-fucosidase